MSSSYIHIHKEKAMLRYRRFKKIASLFRTLEICFVFLFFFWSVSRPSPHYSAILGLFGGFLHRLCKLVVNHHFVFFVGNGIVLTLLLKFGKFACDDRGSADDECLISQVVPPQEINSRGVPPKEMLSEDKHFVPPETEFSPVSHSQRCLVSRSQQEVKRFRRSRSHEYDREETQKIQLRRSETEPSKRSENADEETASIRKTIDVDNLSNEEFQRKVEAFIEQQQRFLREESSIT